MVYIFYLILFLGWICIREMILQYDIMNKIPNTGNTHLEIQKISKPNLQCVPLSK